ncbi:hypothetical protein ACE6H2_000323 [Prunus campanulata]
MSFFTFPGDVESQMLGILLPRLLTLGHLRPLMSHFVDVGRLLPKHLILVKEHAAHVRVSIWTATIEEDMKNIWTATIV